MPRKIPPWDLIALRDEVKRSHGEDMARKTYQCIQSLAIRQDYMKYHYWEAKRLLSDTLSTTDSLTIAAEYIFGVTPEKYYAFHQKRMQAEANLLALLQCVHASYDHLGHVLYFALNFDANPNQRTDEHRISIHHVSSKLPAGPLKGAVNSLIADKTMKHVAALVNKSKHRNIVHTPVAVDCTDDKQPHGLRFTRFQYKGELYKDEWAIPFVNTAFDTFLTHMTCIRILLHEQLEIQHLCLLRLPAPSH